MDIAPGKPLAVLLQDASTEDAAMIAKHSLYLEQLARLDSIDILEAGAEPPPSATALLGAMKILVPMAGLIDVAAERQRLGKNRDRAAGNLDRVRGKLANEKFRANAPAAVIDKEQAKADALAQEIAQLDEQLARLDLI
jgi:valyl-tRNA synthetase